MFIQQIHAPLYLRMTVEERKFAKNFDSIKNGLNSARRKILPRCDTLRRLQGLLENPDNIIGQEARDKIASILNLDGYSMYYGTVESSHGFALVFINPKLEAQRDAGFFGDGTFRTTPLDALQIFNMFRMVDGAVSILIIKNSCTLIYLFLFLFYV